MVVKEATAFVASIPPAKLQLGLVIVEHNTSKQGFHIM